MKDDFRRKGRLFVISGPSGAGKGTICRALLEQAEESAAALSISMTTRKPREGEQDGVHYFFVTKAEFEEKIEQDGFLEYAQVFGNYYGTPRSYVERQLEAGRDVILEIDVQGALNVRRSMPEAVLIFIIPPSMDVLRARLSGRGTETPDQVELRLSKARGEIGHVGAYDYCVVNDVLETAVRRVQAVMEAEHSKVDKEVRDRIRMLYGEES